MCFMCSEDPDEVKGAQNELTRLASDLEGFARFQRSLASGRTKPHDHATLPAGPASRERC